MSEKVQKEEREKRLERLKKEVWRVLHRQHGGITAEQVSAARSKLQRLQELVREEYGWDCASNSTFVTAVRKGVLNRVVSYDLKRAYGRFIALCPWPWLRAYARALLLDPDEKDRLNITYGMLKLFDKAKVFGELVRHQVLAVQLHLWHSVPEEFRVGAMTDSVFLLEGCGECAMSLTKKACTFALGQGYFNEVKRAHWAEAAPLYEVEGRFPTFVVLDEKLDGSKASGNWGYICRRHDSSTNSEIVDSRPRNIKKEFPESLSRVMEACDVGEQQLKDVAAEELVGVQTSSAKGRMYWKRALQQLSCSKRIRVKAPSRPTAFHRLSEAVKHAEGCGFCVVAAELPTHTYYFISLPFERRFDLLYGEVEVVNAENFDPPERYVHEVFALGAKRAFLDWDHNDTDLPSPLLDACQESLKLFWEAELNESITVAATVLQRSDGSKRAHVVFSAHREDGGECLFRNTEDIPSALGIQSNGYLDMQVYRDVGNFRMPRSEKREGNGSVYGAQGLEDQQILWEAACVCKKPDLSAGDVCHGTRHGGTLHMSRKMLESDQKMGRVAAAAVQVFCPSLKVMDMARHQPRDPQKRRRQDFGQRPVRVSFAKGSSSGHACILALGQQIELFCSAFGMTKSSEKGVKTHKSNHGFVVATWHQRKKTIKITCKCLDEECSASYATFYVESILRSRNVQALPKPQVEALQGAVEEYKKAVQRDNERVYMQIDSKEFATWSGTRILELVERYVHYKRYGEWVPGRSDVDLEVKVLRWIFHQCMEKEECSHLIQTLQEIEALDDFTAKRLDKTHPTFDYIKSILHC